MKQTLFTGTIILTISGLICRMIGFIYRIFLSHTIGAEGMGLFQLVLPLFNLCLALSAFGIQTALSRLIAASLAKNEKDKAILTFFTGTILAFSASVLLSFIIRTNASWIGMHMIKEPQCIDLLYIMSIALPFASLHACINGWFYGSKNINVPAVTQIVEEIIRLGGTYLIYMIYLNPSDYLMKHFQWIPDYNEKPTTPVIAVLGLFIAECTSALISYFILIRHINLSKSEISLSGCLSCAKEIEKTGIPLTMNRILLNLLHSAEAILIPFYLKKNLLTASTAIASFGTVTGMALPLVLFPTAIVNAMSTILLPAISAREAQKNNASIRPLVKKSASYSLFMGIGFTLFFSLFGSRMGSLLYNSTEAGSYIQMLSLICPCLFINITLASVMNGLGKSHLCFLVNFINMVLRILCICSFVPVFGIPAYLAGLVGAEAVCSIISIYIVWKKLFSV